LELLEVEQEGSGGGEMVEMIYPMYNIRPFGIVTMNPSPLVQQIYPNKNIKKRKRTKLLVTKYGPFCFLRV
jgi:hypothetical protein